MPAKRDVFESFLIERDGFCCGCRKFPSYFLLDYGVIGVPSVSVSRHCMDEQSQKLEILEENYDRLFKASEGIQAERDRLQEKLDNNKCNTGHETLPLALWECPECTRIERDRLQAEVERLTKERDHNLVEFHKAMDEAQKRARESELNFNHWKSAEQSVDRLRADNDRLQAEYEDLLVDRNKLLADHVAIKAQLVSDQHEFAHATRKFLVENEDLRAEIERLKAELEIRTAERDGSQDGWETDAEEYEKIIDGLVEALKSISDDLNCGDATHFCPNCDRSMNYIKKQANAALEAAEKVRK